LFAAKKQEKQQQQPSPLQQQQHQHTDSSFVSAPLFVHQSQDPLERHVTPSPFNTNPEPTRSTNRKLNTERDPKQELDLYINMLKDVNRSQDPLKWWTHHATIFPRLSVLATKHIVVPCTSFAFDVDPTSCQMRNKRDAVPSFGAEDRLTLLYNEHRPWARELDP